MFYFAELLFFPKLKFAFTGNCWGKRDGIRNGFLIFKVFQSFHKFPKTNWSDHRFIIIQCNEHEELSSHYVFEDSEALEADNFSWNAWRLNFLPILPTSFTIVFF